MTVTPIKDLFGFSPIYLDNPHNALLSDNEPAYNTPLLPDNNLHIRKAPTMSNGTSMTNAQRPCPLSPEGADR